MRSEAGLRSCTPAGVMKLLQEYNLSLEGKKAVVIGRSILVGKPIALMLLEQNATVTMAHFPYSRFSHSLQRGRYYCGGGG